MSSAPDSQCVVLLDFDMIAMKNMDEMDLNFPNDWIAACGLATPGNSNITLPIGFFWSNSSPH